MFLRKLSYPRNTYSKLLRLFDRNDYIRCIITPTKREFSMLMRLRVHIACTCNTLCREFTTPVVNYQQIADEHNKIKIFKDKVKENEYAHNLFLQSIHYAKSTIRQSMAYAHVTNEEALKILEKNWENKQLIINDEILSMLKKLSHNIYHNKNKINCIMYENFFNMLKIQCEKLSDDNLKIMMRYLMPLRSHLKQSNFYQNLCKQLDKECVARFTHLQTNEMLLLCDIIYQIIDKYPNSQYVWYAMRKLGNKPNKLDNHQLVQMLFFLNVCRKPPINMYELEYRLEQCLDELSINELGISLLGFFKTGTPIRSANLLRRIMKKTIANIEFVDSVSIGAILKLIRYSMQLPEIPLLQELLNSLTPHVSRFKLMTLTHIAHSCAKVSLDNRELMDKIIARLNNEIKLARLKDIERLMFVFAHFNIDPSNSIYQNVIDELRTSWNTTRMNEISWFPQEVSRILGYLTILNIYPIDLIKRIMIPEFFSKMCKNNYQFLTREYCVLDYSLQVEVPEYDGPFLKPTIRNMLEKKYFQEYFESTLTESSRMKTLLMDVIQTCKETFNTSDIVVTRPLPHYATPDIIFCLDKSNKFLPSEKLLSQFHPSEIMYVNKISSKDVRWITIVLAHAGLLTRNTNLPVGHLVAKIRQLAKIGYTPILISYLDWNKCKTTEQKQNYLRKLIFDIKIV